VRQKSRLQSEFALRAQLLEDVEFGTAYMAVGDEHQRDDARGGVRAVSGIAAHDGRSLK
jgi:hypothetical protein